MAFEKKKGATPPWESNRKLEFLLDLSVEVGDGLDRGEFFRIEGDAVAIFEIEGEFDDVEAIEAKVLEGLGFIDGFHAELLGE